MFRRLPFAALAASAIVGALTGGAGAYTSYTSARWPNATATFYVNTGSVSDVSPSAAVSAIQTALNAWTTQSGSAIRLYYGGTTSANQLANDGVNAIFFRQASGGAIATNYTWWDGANHLVDSDIVFWDLDRTFFTGTSGCTGGSYVEDVATHELGHAIGLDHSSVADATMYASYDSCSQEFRTLASDDMAGARALYPGSGSSPPPPSNTAPTVSITSPANGASFPTSTSFSLAASAFDSQDGSLSSKIQWTDNGTAIGTGGVISAVLNVAGVHVLVARVTDSGGLQGSAQVSITVTSIAASADGTTIPGAMQIVDDLGAVWSIGAGGAIVRNGLSAAGGRGSLILWTSRTIYVLGSGDWWRWTGSGWAYLGPQPPGGYMSPDGTTTPGATQIVDDVGAVWTIAAGGTILRNGLSAAGGQGSKILWTNRTIYVLGTGDWWRWAGSGWAYVGPQQQAGTSADGTTIPGVTQIVDDLGAVWTIGANGTILRNGLSAAGGQGSRIVWTNRTIYVLGTGDWWKWTGSGWAYVGPTIV